VSESERIRAVYDARTAKHGVAGAAYLVENPEVFDSMLEIDRRLYFALQSIRGSRTFADLRVLEIGCGSGPNLLRFLRWGFRPENLYGNEILDDRAAQARHRLPPAVSITTGDARDADGQFDVVFQSMVLSSVLDPAIRREIAQRMWEMTAPGGAVLSYDFVYNNPRNPDVCRVPVRELRAYWPDAAVTSQSTTLAPPLARRLARRPLVRRCLGAVPLLRTHCVVVAQRAAAGG
jgi:SAM-dependent methyltransferase